ncbi:MAG: anhydro-N-acetylmuramic acid kinase [Emcibacter sp.]|nr:anhydro-N-acetylmuramic acid kinase [Emcibacter sp.]
MNFSKKQFLAIGLMSGTSMDGVDCALIKSNSHTAKAIGKAVHLPYSADMRRDIANAMTEAQQLGKPCLQNERLNKLEVKLTNIHAEAVREILSENNLNPKDIEVVGFHGQTLLHRPDQGWSWQIGDGQHLANMVNISVVNDFRRHDVENGGQGAPFVPVYHQALIKARMAQGLEVRWPIALINIGGVSNITWLHNVGEQQMLAFDTGPGNAFIDDWVKKHTGEPMDIDGALAAKGRVDHGLVKKWLENDYFTLPPPKSLDRRGFNVTGLEKLSLEDGAATLLDFTVKTIQIALEYCPQRPRYIYICGGGRHNKTLMSKLQKMDISVDSVENLGWNGDFLEAEAFAFLACRHLSGLPITFPGTTGIHQPSPGGKLYLPE